MISHAPATPPMSETDVLGVASSVLDISDLASKVSVRLFTLSRKITDALKPIEALSKDVASTGAVLNQLGRQLKKGEDLKVGSSTLVTSVDDLVEECSNIFDSIDKALDGNNTGSKAILGLQHHVHIASLEPQLVLLETNLDRLKTPLALMLNVLIYAEQLKGQETSQLVKEQQELIRVLNEERKQNERRFQKLTTENKNALEDASARARKELPPIPETIDGMPPRISNQLPVQEAKNKEPKARGRVWIKDESPDRASQPAQNVLSTSQGSPGTGQASVRIGSGIRMPRRIPDVREEEDDSSLLDMASFLRFTGPDTPRSSGEDSFSLPVEPKVFRSGYEAREPIIRGNSSDLIKFFRDAAPQIQKKNVTTQTPRSTTPVRQPSDPMTPPLTGRKEMGNRCLLPPHVVPLNTRLLSQSAGLPAPLGSHPPSERHHPSETLLSPESHSSPKSHSPSKSHPPTANHPPAPRSDTSRPATAKWDLQAVLSWLEENSFSLEWQETFRVLQIEGSDFVELESGQSIRKMLTVVYPQLAQECSRSGKGWDKLRERAEGQRLRKLIRELPVDIKYEEGLSTKAESKRTDERSVIRTQTEGEIASGRGRGRVATSPTEDTTPRSMHNNPTLNGSKYRDVSPLTESEEDRPRDIEAPAPVKISDNSRRGRGESEASTSDVPDEWVRKWTVLSREEIDRGRQVASTWLVD